MSELTLTATGTADASAGEVLGIYRRHLSKGRARLASLTGAAMEVASEGSRVWDADAKEYLDCGGYGVFLLGHRHPRVVEAVIEQIHRHPMATRLLLEPAAARAAAALAAVTPPAWSGFTSSTPAPRPPRPRSNWPAPTASTG
ncbi:aminotransferase class III-fold pyridoxal phosphate-dependent enzyme [Streptomyces sp. UC1A3]